MTGIYPDYLPGYVPGSRYIYNGPYSSLFPDRNSCGDPTCPICAELRKKSAAALLASLEKVIAQGNSLFGKYGMNPQAAVVEAVEEETIDLKEVVDDLRNIAELLGLRSYYPNNPSDAIIIRDMAERSGRAFELVCQLISDVKSWLPEEGESGESPV